MAAEIADHHCHARGCIVRTKPEMLMCLPAALTTDDRDFSMKSKFQNTAWEHVLWCLGFIALLMLLGMSAAGMTP